MLDALYVNAIHQPTRGEVISPEHVILNTMNDLDLLHTIQLILLYAIPILFAITVHEVAHGWVANKLGDPTAKMLGRLTLNPIKHIDLIGTIIVPAILVTLGGFIFGWAKPVPITWENLRHPRRDTALVAIAGPLSNLLMAFIWALIIKLCAPFAPNMPVAGAMVAMGQIGLYINLILLVLNILPIPPLDGSRVVSSLLPPRVAARYNRIEPFGFFILLFLLAFGVLGAILLPLVSILHAAIMSVFGL